MMSAITRKDSTIMADEKKKPNDDDETTEKDDTPSEKKKPGDNPKNELKPRPLWEAEENPGRRA
jgi:hypothetical protein